MISNPLIVFTKQSLWLANYKDKKGIYIKKIQKKRSHEEWTEQRRFRTKVAWTIHGAKFVLAWIGGAKFALAWAGGAKFALAWAGGAKFALAWAGGAKFAILSSLYEWQYTTIGTWFVSNSKPVPNMGFLKGDLHDEQNRASQSDSARLQKLLLSSVSSSLLLSFTWLVLMIQKAVKTLKLATNMIRSHCKVLNMPIGIKMENYYTKVLKT